jgi:hypothetical protein
MSTALERLVPVAVEGWIGWMTASGATGASTTGPVPGAYLLPGFDPYTLSPISHREQTIPPGRVNEVSRAAGWIAPVILEEGRIIGTWEAGPGCEVVLQPFERLSKTTLGSLQDHVVSRYHGLLGEDPRIQVKEA